MPSNINNLVFGIGQLPILIIIFSVFWKMREERIPLLLVTVLTLSYSIPIILSQLGILDPKAVEELCLIETGIFLNPGFAFAALSRGFRLYRTHFKASGANHSQTRGKLTVSDFLWLEGLCSFVILLILNAINVFGLKHVGFLYYPVEALWLMTFNHEIIFLGNVFLLTWILYEAKRFPVKIRAAIVLGVSFPIFLEIIHLLAAYSPAFRHSPGLTWTLVGTISILSQVGGLALFRRKGAEC